MTEAPLKGKASGGAAVTDTTLATYDARASRYAARYDEVVPARLQALLRARITPGDHVLELGCGTGRDARFLASIGAKVLATDGSAGMLREAEIREIRERTSEPERRPTYRQLALPPEWEEDRGRAAALAVLGVTEPFDAVVAVGVLQHLSWEALRPTAAFAAAVLKHNGILIASVPTKHPGAKTSDGRWYSDLPVEGYEEVFGAVSLRTAYVSEPELEGPKETPAEWRTVVFAKDSLVGRH